MPLTPPAQVRRCLPDGCPPRLLRPIRTPA